MTLSGTPDNNAPPPSAQKPERKRVKRPRKITTTYLHNAGLYYLQRYAASSAHFRFVMRRKVEKSCAFHTEQNREECMALVEALVIRFQQAGLLDDDSYAGALAASLRRRGLSSRVIRMRMAGKGIAEELISRHLLAQEAESSGDPDIHAAIQLARRKRLGPFSKDGQESTDREDKTRVMGKFGRAGFSYEIAQTVLAMSREEAEELIAQSRQD